MNPLSIGQTSTGVEQGLSNLPTVLEGRPQSRSSFRQSSEATLIGATGSMRRGSVDGVVNELFSHPGDRIGEAEVDREVEMEGLVKQAETFLES